jgi:hypothetical protein
MNRRIVPLVCIALGAVIALAACVTPTPQIIAQADRVATRVAEELAVAGTLTALAPTAPPSATATRPPQTAAASPTPTRLTVTVVSARTATPSPTRLQITVAAPTPTRLQVTAPAHPAPTVTRLLLTVAPAPSPPVRPTPTPLQVAVLPVDGSDGNRALHNARNVMEGRNVLLPGFSQSAVKNPMIFKDRLVFQVEVFDETVGKRDGDGIASVTFTISDESGKVVYTRTETTAPYCVFSGEQGCAVWQFSKQGNRWPGGATLRYGGHDVQITIQPKQGAAVNWFWGFRIEK